MSILTISSQALAYEDEGRTSNPSQRPINWMRQVVGVVVSNPITFPVDIEPLSTVTVIDGTRATAIDGTSAFSLGLSPLGSGRYRLSHTGGTAPAFRARRTVATTGIELTVTVGSNLAVTVTAGSGTPFADVQSGDVVFLPGVSTGDTASVFNTMNLGYWTALTVSDTVLVMIRTQGTVFDGVGEVVTPAADTQFQVFANDGVQVGYTLELASGFAPTSLRAYRIVAVNPSWVEVVSTFPLGSETGVVPTADGLLIYKGTKRWVSIEVDQECVVRINNDVGNFQRITPWIAGNRTHPGEFRKTGPVWKLQLVNLTNTTAKAVVLSAE